MGWVVLFSGLTVVLVVHADAMNQSHALVDLLGGLIALGGLGILLFFEVLRRGSGQLGQELTAQLGRQLL